MEMMDPINFHSMVNKQNHGSLIWLHSSKYLLLFSRKKEIHTGLEQLEGE